MRRHRPNRPRPSELLGGVGPRRARLSPADRAGTPRAGDAAARRRDVRDRDVRIELELEETAGVETVWRPAPSTPGRESRAASERAGTSGSTAGSTLDARAVVDDTAGYHPRHTRWSWSAGVGMAGDGREVAWNLVAGINDAPSGSERTVWIAGEPREVPPSTFAPTCRRSTSCSFTPRPNSERPEPDARAQRLPAAVRHVLGRAAGWPDAHRGLWGDGAPRRVVVNPRPPVALQGCEQQLRVHRADQLP